MKKIFILFFICFILGCVTPPQTTSDLREGVKRGAFMTKMDKLNIDRPFTAVYNDIKANADKCLNVNVRTSTTDRYVLVQTMHFRSTSKKTSGKKAEMVLQLNDKATGKMPPGGYFVMLTDIEAISTGKTRVSIYGSVGYDPVFEAIFSWAKGKKQECPKLPGM